MSAFHPQFDRLFEFGIDPVDGRLPQDQASDWPGIEEILSYRDRVRRTVDELLERASLGDSTEPFVQNGQIFRVAIEHRLMHAETLAYMFHWLPYEMKSAAGSLNHSSGSDFPAARKTKTQVNIPAGDATLGQEANHGATFGWDNEFQVHTVFVPEFSIDAFNVTPGYFLQFVREGGYGERSLWTDEGWDWIRQAAIRYPKFWLQRGDQWFYRTMFGEIPLPNSWPVYVSHAEASAYARWKNRTLPTEAQYDRAAFGSPEGAGQAPVSGGNFNFESWMPVPVGSSGSSAFGVFDMVGNGWEWTNTPFAPFDGFQPFPFYPGYSANFFDGKHFVLKGASPRTAAALARRSFRNWFQPYYPNIYATFRCVEA
jgi:ergothioneine biosynthesis protein EgtB